ncbi:hypothetical protein PN419_17960 [Halorubrum ezzemoulense]|uniref:hypothetical protein n=1 Tax=Halorubrum ezzemoulense TaxID=337243 RepID=UPI00232EDE08|nr:hypothetical protein [Halorubrum ezzemoulense]MDB9250856.1 hypothetical protein [Halorubrum ezzemoulense]MDB9261027.1 hypothetical protein [Halorubrum ezzemoulense]MDB9264421.1 hypothetical protein [Halorubrum ezzemoulense]MDB9267904.1 hypothetical protein [Halorubrum ezzemoulense]MDB9271388.1 hypothetical protein [Halorubrum ezzemoulense]
MEEVGRAVADEQDLDVQSAVNEDTENGTWYKRIATEYLTQLYVSMNPEQFDTKPPDRSGQAPIQYSPSDNHE